MSRGTIFAGLARLLRVAHPEAGGFGDGAYLAIGTDDLDFFSYFSRAGMQQPPTNITAHLCLLRHHQDDTPRRDLLYPLTHPCQLIVWIKINDLLFWHCPALPLQIDFWWTR
jgi:hypothetical protein